MVLTDLGQKLSSALQKFSKTSKVDAAAVEALVKDVSLALIKADVNADIIRSLKKDLIDSFAPEEIQKQPNPQAFVQGQVVKRIVQMLDPQVNPPQFKRGKANVVMFVGLQGSGKTTSIAKFGLWHKKRGWRVGMVCADTFRDGAFDQLKQNAERVSIPFYGSYEEKDPVKIAAEGVEHFQKAGVELIIVDTSGRHKQSDELFDEMKDVAEVIKPDETIFVMDATIGQAAREQAEAFKSAVNVGAIIVTKLDGNAKGGGALSAIAGTHAPIIFIGTGEDFNSLEPFSAESFVSRMLGFGDMRSLIRDMQEQFTPDSIKPLQEAVVHAVQGEFSLADFRTQLETILRLGPLSRTISSIPGFSQLMAQAGNDAEMPTDDMFKKWLIIMDSMTEFELHTLSWAKEVAGNNTRESRLKRIARGSGSSTEEVITLIQNCRQIGKMFEMVLSGNFNPGAMAKQMSKGRKGRGKGVTPDMAKAMSMLGGAGGMGAMMKNAQAAMRNGGLGMGMPGMPLMPGGPGGMPDFSRLSMLGQLMKDPKKLAELERQMQQQLDQE